MSDTVERNRERDPFYPQWVGVYHTHTVETEHVLYCEIQVERFQRPIILSKPAPEVWNKHPDRATSIVINGFEFGRTDQVPPTAYSKGVLVFSDQDVYPLVVARETVEKAVNLGWRAQVAAEDYVRWVSGTV